MVVASQDSEMKQMYNLRLSFPVLIDFDFLGETEPLTLSHIDELFQIWY